MAEQQNPALRIEQVSLDHLRTIAQSGELYAIADATDAPAVPKKVLELGPQRAVSLYRGTAEEEFWDVAPYLIHVDAPVLDWIVSTLDRTRWGIFAASKANLDTLRTHFRHFLKVQPPEDKPWFFRFYDPRVLRPFLPACNVEELRILFGPVGTFGLGSADTRAVSFHRLQPQSAGASSRQVMNPSLFFRLRQQHLEALRPQADAAFAREVINYLQTKQQRLVADLPEDELEQRVLSGLARARQYGFKRNSSFAAFVTIMLDIAPNFDEQPAIRAILNDRSIHPDLRIDTLIQHTTERDWEQAKLHSNPEVWRLHARKG